MATGPEDAASVSRPSSKMAPVAITADELAFLKDNRKHLRSKVTRLINSINTSLENLALDDLEDHLQTFNSYSSQLDSLNEKISSVLWIHEQRREVLNNEMDTCEKYQSDICRSVRQINKKCTELKNAVIASTSNGNQVLSSVAGPSGTQPVHNVVPNKLQLPQLPLPEFSNSEGECLSQFIAGFEAIISKYNLSQYEKFIYLCRQLKSSPLLLVRSLQGEEQSYDHAKALLEEGFASKIQQKFDVLNRLTKLKLSSNTDPFAFISDIKILISSSNRLQIATEDVLLHFIWKAMPLELRSQFTAITNEHVPSLRQVEDNLFAAIK